MLEIINAIKQISSMAPANIPALELPALPNINAAHELAHITGGSSAAIAGALNGLTHDSATIEQTRAQAMDMVKHCVEDLIQIGIQALAEAAVPALGLLVPNPAAQAAARVMLKEIAQATLQQAVMRIGQLVLELVQLIPALLGIAAHNAVSALNPEGKHARDSLRKETTTPSSSQSHSSSSSTVSALGSEQGKQAAKAALSQVGKPYAWGGTGKNGFDCSGLTQWAYRQAGIDIPRLAEEQAIGTQIHANELQAGDLAVWDGHVAMITNKEHMVEAGSPVQVSPVRTTNMGMQFKGFWRPTSARRN